MKALVSPADIKRAREAAEAAVVGAYGPMDVKGEQLCWEGRIARGQEKASELIAAGAVTREQIEAILDDFVHQYKLAEAEARRLQDVYFDLCQKAGTAPQIFSRPACPCRYCTERVDWSAVENYKRAVATVLDSQFADNEAIQLARAMAELCASRRIAVTITIEGDR